MSLSRPSISASTPSSTLAEVFADPSMDGSAAAFALAHLGSGATRVLWVQDRLSRQQGGRPYFAGVAELAGAPIDLLHLQVNRAVDVLWAMEQALGCPILSAVVGEVWGTPAVLDFTATKRLALRAERSGVSAWLLRRGAAPDLSAARERWRVASLPSPPAPDDLHSPGEPVWRATLFRSRRSIPGEHLARRDPQKGGLALAPPTGQEGDHGAVPDRHGPRAA